MRDGEIIQPDSGPVPLVVMANPETIGRRPAMTSLLSSRTPL